MALKSEEINTPIRPKDSWRVRRIAIGCLLGFASGTTARALDFWPDKFATGLHAFVSLLGGLLLLLIILITVIAYFVAALISLCRLRFRRMASSLIAIIVIPLCVLTIGRVPIFDPWLWYVILNKSTLEAEVKANKKPSSDYTTLEERDESDGLPFAGGNHFIALIYSESNLDGQKTDNSSITHIYGNFYRRDTFM